MSKHKTIKREYDLDIINKFSISEYMTNYYGLKDGNLEGQSI